MYNCINLKLSHICININRMKKTQLKVYLKKVIDALPETEKNS